MLPEAKPVCLALAAPDAEQLVPARLGALSDDGALLADPDRRRVGAFLREKHVGHASAESVLLPLGSGVHDCAHGEHHSLV